MRRAKILYKNIENQKMRHHEAIQIARTKHDMAMDEINQKASIEINRLHAFNLQQPMGY